MMQSFRAEKALGYGQFAAGGVDASTLLNTITVNGTAGIPAGTVLAVISPEAQAIRYRDDGTAPTAAVGQPLAAGATLFYTARNFQSLRLIAAVAGAVVNVTFYGQDS